VPLATGGVGYRGSGPGLGSNPPTAYGPGYGVTWGVAGAQTFPGFQRTITGEGIVYGHEGEKIGRVSEPTKTPAMGGNMNLSLDAPLHTTVMVDGTVLLDQLETMQIQRRNMMSTFK
jgi:hypothetical protein